MSAAAESSMVGAKCERVSKLKKELLECQKETQRLVNEKQRRLVSLRGTLDFNVAILRRKLKKNSIDRISFEQELEYLKDSLEIQKVYESELNERLRTVQLEYDEYKKSMEFQLRRTEHSVAELDKFVSAYPQLDELYKRRVEMEQRNENFDVFCDSIYSTLGLKDSSAVRTTHSFVKDDKVITI
ncbi:hypothetical protein M0R45_035395 [Rubus argutus]|uniref:Uncharacterized protein n=1 Tax=Rubus argutus TaxID=59490 RepID=A0AAW1VWU4_RUBAR